MKKSVLLTICFSLTLSAIVNSQAQKSKETRDDANAIVVYSVPEIEPLVKTWAKEFNTANPGFNVNVAKTGTGQDLMFATDGTLPETNAQWRTVVGREIVVPVIGTGNPLIDEISFTGMSRESMMKIFTRPGADSWKTLPGNKDGNAVHCYIVNDASVLSQVTDFLGISENILTAEVVADAPALLEALEVNPLSIGFCRLPDITSATGHDFIQGVRPVPIDINSNGASDYFEQIYADYNSFTRGVYIGKYPKELFSNVFCVSESYPDTKAEVEFLRFIMTRGQSNLLAAGYTELASGENQSRLAGLNEEMTSTAKDSESSSLMKSFLWLLAAVIAVSAVAYAIYRYIRSGITVSDMADKVIPSAFSERSLIIPKGLLFDKTHTWAFMEKDGQVRVGIDDFLQHVTGTITRIRMKDPGDSVKKGEPLLSLVQNGKQLKIYSPVTGKVTGRNDNLAVNSSLINSSPYIEGWVYTIEPDSWLKESHFMIMADGYLEWIRSEFARIRDFLAQILGKNNLQYSHLVLQDGGELREDLLEEFGPVVWEDFQAEFIDKSR